MLRDDLARGRSTLIEWYTALNGLVQCCDSWCGRAPDVEGACRPRAVAHARRLCGGTLHRHESCGMPVSSCASGQAASRWCSVGASLANRSRVFRPRWLAGTLSASPMARSPAARDAPALLPGLRTVDRGVLVW